MAITLTSHGAAGEVTGSKHLLEIGGTGGGGAGLRLLVDCGAFQGPRSQTRERNASLPFDPRTIDVCVNTHGHLDHVGSYPLLVKRGFDGPIVATPATRDVAGLVMRDSAKIAAQDVRFLRRQQARDPQPWREAPEPLYDERDVQAALERYVTVSYHRRFPLGAGAFLTFQDAGHILGSATVRIALGARAADGSGDGEGALAIGFTGDLGRPGTPILRDPEPMAPVDWLVCESTYGNRRHEDTSTAEDELAAAVRDTVHRGGRVIIPAFAVGRTQELVYMLHRLYDAGRIPEVPVFVDSPMAVSATAIFRAHPECYDAEAIEEFLDRGENPFTHDRLSYVTDRRASKALNDRTDPCIVIASSGMCEAGRVLHHLAQGIGDPRNTILIVGFMGHGTLGRAIAERLETVRIFGEPHRLRADVRVLNAFSAHADYVEIGDWVKTLDLARLKGIFLVHGEPDAQTHMAAYLRGLGVKRVEPLAAGRPVVLTP